MTKSWIPCTERLPKKGREVLICTTYPRHARLLSIDRCHYVCIGWLEYEGRGWRYIEWPEDHSRCGWNSVSVAAIRPGDEFVKAWMPLPERFQED